MRYHVVTLGCKLNQFDSAVAKGLLGREGASPEADPDQADVIVLNTCTVTARADAEARKIARRLRKTNARARLVATGCYAERDREALESLGVFDEIVGLKDRGELLAALTGRDTPVGVRDGDAACGLPPVSLHFGERARSFLKIQEGCDLVCTYCVIPSVRGNSRSVDADAVIEKMRELAAQGSREICVTGVNTGAWGRDLDPRMRLSDLLRRFLDTDIPARLRLNSLEPKTVSRDILEMIAAEPERIVPHIQIPLQSGCDRILRAMRRNYRRREYQEILTMADEILPDGAFGADIITGFPGETDEDHEDSLAFISGLPLAYLHVFAYSRRPGTPADTSAAHVKPSTIRERSAALRGVGDRLAQRFRGRMLGKRFPAVVLGALSDDGQHRTLTSNYLEVLVPDAPTGEVIDVLIASRDSDGLTLRGKMVEKVAK